MSVFKDYSRYYDLLYSDKDYYQEVEYIHQLIQKECPGASSILNLGCGTGKHDLLLAEKGYTIIAVDLSETMIQIAEVNSSHPYIKYCVGDVRSFKSDQTFDVVLSLFHVVSYQTENIDLIHTFKTAKNHLKEGGAFIFDCWYGPGVLVDPPQHKFKEVENNELRILRETTPVLHESENCVDVRFDINIADKVKLENFNISELHKMRYLFLPEIKLISDLCDLEFIRYSKWMENDEPTMGDWYIVTILKNTENKL